MNLLYNVFLREYHRITSRGLYLGVCVILPLFCLFFMATIFGNGQMENIPIGIVDRDNTATSRSISRRISATPAFRVAKHFTDEASARQALQQKEQTGMVLVTHNLAVLEQMADRVAVLKDGNIVEQGETRTVFDHPKDEYTKNLLAAVPGRGKNDA